jgi:uncharacterized protein (TIGR02217 family)
MSNAIFPTFKGLTWPVPKRQLWKTLDNQAESGYETRVGLRSLPLYEWDLPFSFLLTASDLAAFWGFYAARGGSFDPFLFSDEMDNFAPGAALGTGDGNTTVFQFIRSLGGLFVEARNDIQQSPVAPKIYLNGALQTTGYTISYFQSGTVTFAAAPGSGVAITADFYFYYRVKFKDDSQELQAENIAYATGKKITLAQVRA